MATIDKSSRDRDGSFSNVIDPRRISVLSVTTGPEPPKSGAEKLRDFFYPDWSIADAKNPRFWKDLLIEFICCTYFITLVDWVLVTNHLALYSPNTGQFGLFAGFLVFALVEAWHPLHGGTLNPAGTWGFWLCGRMSLLRFFLSSAVETAGSAAGGMIGHALTPHNTTLHALKPVHGLSEAYGMSVELLVTFHLILVALSVTNPKKHSNVAALAIGFCKGSGILAGGTFTGGLANPIVPFGPAVATGDFEFHFVVYWLGPYIGATLSAIVYLFAIKVNNAYPPTPERPVHPAIAAEPQKCTGCTCKCQVNQHQH